ncbi:hypothetical protein ACWD4F_39585 [Streptomyces aureus]
MRVLRFLPADVLQQRVAGASTARTAFAMGAMSLPTNRLATSRDAQAHPLQLPLWKPEVIFWAHLIQLPKRMSMGSTPSCHSAIVMAQMLAT